MGETSVSPDVLPLRWVLVRDPACEFRPQAFLRTDPDAAATDILAWFVRRWATETTFEEAHRHLGVETQRQWSDPAIARTTPILLGLYCLVALCAHGSGGTTAAPAGRVVRQGAMDGLCRSSFSDATAALRRRLWVEAALHTSRPDRDLVQVPRPLLDRLTTPACYAA